MKVEKPQYLRLCLIFLLVIGVYQTWLLSQKMKSICYL